MSYRIKGETCAFDEHGDIAIRAKLQLITPEIAISYLSNNPNNRKLRSQKVAALAKDMSNGNWKTNGESIILRENGELADGQHRLSAVVASGCSILSVVVTVPNSEAEYIDVGLIRSTGDIISLSQDSSLQVYNDTKLIGAMSYLVRRKLGIRGNSVSKPEIITEMKKHADILDWYMTTPHFAHRKDPGIGMSPVIAAILAAFRYGYPQDKLEAFGKVLSNGLIESENHIPVIKLRDWLVRDSKSYGEGMSRQEESYMRTIYALKAVEINNAKALCKAATKDYYQWS